MTVDSYCFGFLLQLLCIFLLSFALFISCLAATNRSPLNFTEGKSELVSGYNTECGAGGFLNFCLRMLVFCLLNHLSLIAFHFWHFCDTDKL